MRQNSVARRRRESEAELRRARRRVVGPQRRRVGRPTTSRYLGQFRPEFSRLHREADLGWVMPLRARYILGIVGRRFSGRSALLHHLELDKGFAVYNLEDVLAERLFFAHTVQPAGDPLRKIAVETRREEQSSGVIGNWAAQSIRRDHL